VIQQSRRIDQLEAMVTGLAEHIRTRAQPDGMPVNDRPPHY
jgi:SlyX protein